MLSLGTAASSTTMSAYRELYSLDKACTHALWQSRWLPAAQLGGGSSDYKHGLVVTTGCSNTVQLWKPTYKSDPSTTDTTVNASDIELELLHTIATPTDLAIATISASSSSAPAAAENGNTEASLSPLKIACGCLDARIVVLGVTDTPQVLHTLQTRALECYAVAYSPVDQYIVAAGNAKGGINLHDVRNDPSIVGQLSGGTASDDVPATTAGGKPASKPHNNMIMSTVYSRDGTRLASGSNNGTVTIYDTATERVVATYPAIHSGPVRALTVSHYSDDSVLSHNVLLSGSDDGCIAIFDIVSGQLITVITNAHSSWVTSLAWSPDSLHFVSTGMDSRIRIWEYSEQTANAATHSAVMTFKHPTSNIPVWSAAYSSDGRQLVAVDDAGGIRMYQTLTTTSAR